MWSQVVGGIWGTLSYISRESPSLPRREFVLELCSAVMRETMLHSRHANRQA